MQTLTTTQTNTKTTPTSQRSGPLTDAAKAQVLKSGAMGEKQLAQYSAAVAVSIFKLRTAFHTQARSFKDWEIDALTALWIEMFTDFAPADILEAVARFIKADRGGFFPAPGQVIGVVEQIVSDREREEKARIDAKRNLDRMRRLLVKMTRGGGKEEDA